MANKKGMAEERTMKKVLFLAIMSLCAAAAFCQDIILMKSGDEIEAIIVEIGSTEVTYKEHGNPDGAVHTVLKSDIFQIKYENGNRVLFSEVVTNTPAAHENFTTGQRVGTWLLNSLLPGIGSFAIMKDNRGGGIQLGVGTLAYILTIAGAVKIVKGAASEYKLVQDAYGFYSYEWVNDEGALKGGIAMTVIGSLLFTGNGIFNIIRSVTYDKPAPAVAGGFDWSGLQIALLPGSRVGLSYTMRF
jgi:hypothetical protein